jgi:hypothetical protein
MNKLETELRRSKPDYVVYKPESLNKHNSGNQHFIVFNGPDETLMAIWTRHTKEGSGNHHIVFSKSKDEGLNWSNPRIIAGTASGKHNEQASWAFPMVSSKGRIYVLYNRATDVYEKDPMDEGVEFRFRWDIVNGNMEGIYSDDAGETWSEPQQINMKKSCLDNPDSAYPPGWIVWQKPERLSEGKFFVGYTCWVSPAVRTPRHNNSIHSHESVCQFMRFENIDNNPDPEDIVITYHAFGNKALRVPYYNNPTMSCAQEPSIVKLPDGRLFVVMRTMAGTVWYAVSKNQGLNWSNPAPLLYHDHGQPILNPLCCCPVYQRSDGKYLLFHYNNDGRVPGLENPEFGNVSLNRRPCSVAVGCFKKNAYQPIWFDPSKIFMDSQAFAEDVGTGVGLYGSFTVKKPKDVWWFTDRKIFLVGKETSGV